MRWPLPSVDRVRELFAYDPATGILTRRVAVPKAPAGSAAGTKNNLGRLICRVDYRIYYVHRLVWLHFYGEAPPRLIDHVNGQPDDNRIENLRLADEAQNCWNRRASKSNRTGIKGAHYSSIERKWKSSIRVRGRAIHLGYFRTQEEAGAAYAKAAAVHQREFARA